MNGIEGTEPSDANNSILSVETSEKHIADIKEEALLNIIPSNCEEEKIESERILHDAEMTNAKEFVLSGNPIERSSTKSLNADPSNNNLTPYSSVQSENCMCGTESNLASDAAEVAKNYENLKSVVISLQEDFMKVIVDNNKTKCDDAHQICSKKSLAELAKSNLDKETGCAELISKLRENMMQHKALIHRYNMEKAELVLEKEDLAKILADEREDQEERIQSLKERLNTLEGECVKYKEESVQCKERLAAHDLAAKRAITSIQNEASVKVAQVTKMYEDSVVDKDGMLIKISKAEIELSTSQKRNDFLEKKCTENNKEIERLKQQLKDKDVELRKSQAVVTGKEKEITDGKTEFNKQKEEISSVNVKLKWAQNKLKQELECHKETKKQVTALTTKLKEAKEEGEQIRIACQDMIKQYQDSEEMKSVQLDHKLKETENAMKIHEHEIAVQDEAHRIKTQELQALKASHRKAKEKILEMQSQIASLETKVTENDSLITKYKQEISDFHELKGELETKCVQLAKMEEELKRYDQQIQYYQALENNLRCELQETESDLKASKQKESELLTFSEKLAENNAQAMTSANNLDSRVHQLTQENEKLLKQIEKSKAENTKKVNAIAVECEQKDKIIEDLTKHLRDKETKINELAQHLEDTQDEVKVLKRKKGSTLKDLQRELQQSIKKMEHMESILGDSQDNLSAKSRTSSNCSLDKLSNSSPQYSSNPSLSAVEQPLAEYSIVQPAKQQRLNSAKSEIEVDKSILIERICRLQKAHAKKNDKLDFLEEHIKALVEELKRKNRIISYYVEREEAGTLAPNISDENKVEMSKKGGIMASVYSSKPSDKHMTLELSLQINRKLQAVLEDTLLENITLKKSISTLGEEISRLQRDQSK